VAPTVLSTLGIEPAAMMDGDPLPVVDASSSHEYPDYDTQSQTIKQDSDVAERLSDLGYLE
jgi:hypothetical protein